MKNEKKPVDNIMQHNSAICSLFATPEVILRHNMSAQASRRIRSVTSTSNVSI